MYANSNIATIAAYMLTQSIKIALKFDNLAT